MRTLISLIIIIISLITISGCVQPEDTRTPGEVYSQKTIHLQEGISDYFVTVEEQLQNGDPAITREILVKRPSMYRIKEATNCYSISNGSVLWSYCNESDNLRAFSDPSVRGFIADVDYQQIFSSMLGASPAILKGNDTIDSRGTWILETTPPRSSAYRMRYDYDSVRLWVDENTGMILRAEMIPTTATNIGIIRFSNITINQRIPDETFMFIPPAGVAVNNQPGQGLYAEGLDKAAGYTHAAKPCTDCPFPTRTPDPLVNYSEIAYTGTQDLSDPVDETRKNTVAQIALSDERVRALLIDGGRIEGVLFQCHPTPKDSGGGACALALRVLHHGSNWDFLVDEKSREVIFVQQELPSRRV